MVKFLLINHAEPIEDLYELATRGSKDVTLVEMLSRIGADIGRSTRWSMLQDLDRYHVNVLPASTAMEIKASSVVVTSGGTTSEIPTDTVVLALGSRSYNPLEETVKKKGIPCYVIGDAGGVAKAFDAIHQGFQVGRMI
jgi:2,4-dienoyl-CoA reductase (NADPH2)